MWLITKPGYQEFWLRLSVLNETLSLSLSGGQKQRIAIARALLKVSLKPQGWGLLLVFIRDFLICN